MTLNQLSAAATQGEWVVSNSDDDACTFGRRKPVALKAADHYEIIACNTTYYPTQITEENAVFIACLVNAYRTGQLVAVADDAIERVARTLAPNLEGGREFDQMPKDRAQLRQWTAQGMCLINDATQDDATWLAGQAIAAMKDTQPTLAAKGTGDE